MADEVDRLEIAVDVAAKNANRSLSALEQRIGKIADHLEKILPLTSAIDNLGNFNMSGLKKAQDQMDAIFDSEKKISRQKAKPRVDRSDLKYTSKSLDEIYDKFKKVGTNADFSNLGLKELEAGLRQSESAARRLNERLEKKIATEGTEKLGKSWESLVYDIQKATNQAEMYREAIQKIKSQSPDLNIERNMDIPSVEMPDTSEIRKTSDTFEKYDSSEIQKFIDNFAGATRQANTFEEQIKSLKSQLSDLASQGYTQFDPEYDAVAQELAEVTEAQKKYNKEMRETARRNLGLEDDNKNINQLKKEMDKATKSTSNFKKALDSIKRFTKAINEPRKAISDLRKALTLTSKQANKGMSFGRMLGSSVLFSFVFQGISAIQTAIKEGSDNLVQYSAEYNRSISSMVSSLLYLKNAWASAFSPIVNVVAPYISAFIDMIASSLNAVGQFMAALTGKGFAVQAKKVWKDYGASIADAGSNASDAADGINDAANAMKDLQSYTLGIDELNIIQPNDTSTSGSGGSGGIGGTGAGGATEISPSDMFETVEIDSSISKLSDLFKEAWEKADFTEIGRIVGDKVNGALESINWTKIKGTAYNIGKSVATFLNGTFETPNLYKNIGNTIGNGLNTAIYLAKGFIDNFDWSDFGQSIADAMNGFFETVEWDTLAETISDGVIGLLKTAQGFLKAADWEEVANSIVDFLTSIKWGEIIAEGIATLIAASVAQTEFFESIGKAISQKIIKSITGKEFSEELQEKFDSAIQPIKDIWNYLFSSVNPVTNALKIMSLVGETIETKGQNIKDFLGKVWEDIKIIFFPVTDWFDTKFSAAKDAVENAFQFLGSWFEENVKNPIQKTVDSLAESIPAAFKKAKEGIENAFSNIGAVFRNIANKAIEPINSLIGGIIGGVNWIGDKLGVGTVISGWKDIAFAKGSDGVPRNMMGVVNDQKGSTYKEMIVPPNGKAFIPKGRNVMLPLQKGTKIMPANQTKEFMKMSRFPHFAGGIGDFFNGAWEKVKDIAGSIWDYVQNPEKILQIALNKFVDMTSMFDPWTTIAGGVVNKIFDGAVSFIKSLLDKAIPEVNYVPSAGVEQWRALAKKALEMTGQYSEDNLNRLLMQMQTESGGNPNAINNWDINAKNGTPSKGLMQVIDPTFKAYAYPGYSSNIYDPLSNILAAIRYTVSRYGTLANGWKGHGYASGIGVITMSDLVRGIPKLADGGVPSKGQIFMARERGPELVGSYGGRTAVMNNDQIVKSVSIGVGNAVDAAVALILNKMEEIQEVQEQIRDKKTDVNIDGKRADKLQSKARRNTGYQFSPT